MKFRYSVVSDLHLDFPQPKTPPFDTDLVVVAGDCGNGLIGLKYLNKLKRRGHTVFAVDGNHEHYANVAQGRTLDDTEIQFYEGAPHQGAFLDLGAGLAIVGCNGWYQVEDEQAWLGYMTDGRVINANAEQVSRHAAEHAQYLDDALSSWDGKAIVVTHTAPTMETLDPRYEGHYSNAWYWNPMMEPVLIKHADKILAWHHGHTHTAVDKVVHGVRIVTNPRGYPGENPGWKPLVMEVDL